MRSRLRSDCFTAPAVAKWIDCPLLINRFRTSDNGPDDPWRNERTGDDGAETTLPDFIQAALSEWRERISNTADTPEAQSSTKSLRDELDFLSGLTTDDEDEEFWRNANLKRLCRSYATDKFRPNQRLRGELNADIAMIMRVEETTWSKGFILSGVISAYLEGRYSPDAHERERIVDTLSVMKVTLADGREVEDVPLPVEKRRILTVDCQAVFGLLSSSWASSAATSCGICL